MYRFEKLKVYHDSVDLVEKVYKVTALFPATEKFSLVDQLKRSVTSITLNIAEGTGAKGDIELVSYLRTARKSLYETIVGLKLAERLFKIKTEFLIIECDNLGKKINALIKYLSSVSKQ